MYKLYDNIEESVVSSGSIKHLMEFVRIYEETYSKDHSESSFMLDDNNNIILTEENISELLNSCEFVILDKNEVIVKSDEILNYLK